MSIAGTSCSYDADREKPGLKAGAVEALRRRVGWYPKRTNLSDRAYNAMY
jgi:hypothetical protein